MKGFLVFFMITFLVIFYVGSAGAQFPFWFGPFNPYTFSLSYPMHITMFNPIQPSAPFLFPRLSPIMPLPVLSPPKSMIRRARATVTIFFNPTQSVIQLTVLPLGSPIAPVPVVAPSALVPAIGPTALALLPLLSGLGGTTPQTQLNTIGSVPPITPVTTAPTGLSGLLPFI